MAHGKSLTQRKPKSPRDDFIEYVGRLHKPSTQSRKWMRMGGKHVEREPENHIGKDERRRRRKAARAARKRNR